MNFTEEDVNDAISVLKYGDLSPLVSTELQNVVKDKLSLISAHYNKDNEQFRKLCVESFEFFSHDKKKWELLYFIRCVVHQGIVLTYTVVPEFKIIVQNYSKLIRAARASENYSTV